MLRCYVFGIGRKRAADWWRQFKPATHQAIEPSQAATMETSSLPKFAFALLLFAIAGLGSGLAIVKAQSKALSQVLVFDLDLPRAEHPLHGAVYVNRGRDNRGMTFMIGTADPLGMLKGGAAHPRKRRLTAKDWGALPLLSGNAFHDDALRRFRTRHGETI